jgi:hypothetical protein
VDAELLEESERSVKEAEGAASGFVWEELSEGNSGMIIDGDVQILPAGAGGVIVAIARNAVAGALDARELFDVEMDEITRPLTLITTQRPRRLQSALASETVAAQQTRDGGLGDFGLASDLEAWEFSSAQSQNAGDAQAVGGSGGTFGARTAVVQTGRALGAETGQPLVDAALRNAESGGDSGDRLLEFENAFNHLGSTQRREPGLTMHVHAAVLGWWLCDNPIFPGPRRMNNLLKLHT